MVSIPTYALLRNAKPPCPRQDDSQAEFAYDYLGRRTVQTVSSWTGSAWTVVSETKYVWAGWLMLMELDGLSSDAVLRRNTWGLDLAGQMGSVGVPPASLQSAGGIGGLLAVSDANGTPANPNDDLAYVYFYDANGNVGQVFDPATQAVVAHYEYDPYGNVTNDLSGYAYAETNRWRFSTKQFDAATGLGYWGRRYYEPILGRWLNHDPIGEAGGENLYAYVRNQPASHVDAFGRDVWDFTPLLKQTVCCKYRREYTSIGSGSGGAGVYSETDHEYYTTGCLCRYKDPLECCKCSDMSGENSAGGLGWSTSSSFSLVDAREGPCCYCTMSILRGPWHFWPPTQSSKSSCNHHVVQFDCPDDKLDGYIHMMPDMQAWHPTINRGTIRHVGGLYTGGGGALITIRSRRVSCDLAEGLLKDFETRRAIYSFGTTDCRQFAFRLWNVIDSELQDTFYE